MSRPRRAPRGQFLLRCDGVVGAVFGLWRGAAVAVVTGFQRGFRVVLVYRAVTDARPELLGLFATVRCVGT